MEVLDHIFAGKNVIGVLKTSGGKSGIFQIPTLARPGLTVVVSPLVALMMDQVDRLRAHGVEAYALNSHCTAVEKRDAIQAIEEGRAKLVYMSPERMQGIDATFFGKSRVQMFAIDEAHCISEWGHDFRPPYLRVGRFIARLAKSMESNPQIVALTATATDDVVDEIAKTLRIEEDAIRIIKTPDRPNITYGVAGDKVSLVRLVESAGRAMGDPLPCLVYGSTRKSVEAAATELARSGYKTNFYHAGLSKDERVKVQERFIRGEVEILAATCAFGMGIDHGGIRSVIHLEMPTSLEAYAQESGRGGRDGSPAIAICRATIDTLHIAQSLTALAWPTPKRVREFWYAMRLEFRPLIGKWEGADAVQKTNVELGTSLGFEPIEVESCLRILHHEGFVKVVPYQDRPVEVALLEGSNFCTGRRQREVLERLRRYADASGVVKGSVAFFSNVIGVDRTFLREMSARQALQMDWTEKCQIVYRLRNDQVAEFDSSRIVAVRARALNRIEAARGFLSVPVGSCRRDYLLRYFGDNSGGEADVWCCDRCPKGEKKRVEATSPSAPE